MEDRRVLFFVKWPEPGRVKTRLAADVGADAAATLYRAFVADELSALAGAGVPVTVCWDPDGAPETGYRAWLADAPLTPAAFLPQRGADIGQRMAAAFAEAFASGTDQAALIGSDVPLLTASDVTGAFEALATHGAALAPSDDDGYTIIAFTRQAFAPEIFDDVPWSTPGVLPTTIARFRDAGRGLTLLPELPDADDTRALAALTERFASGDGPHHTLATWRKIAP